MLKKILLIFCFSVFAAAADLVVVSIQPLASYIKEISGNSVKVEVMVQKGKDAHTYEPSVSQMKKLARAKAFFAIGIDYEEKWIPKFSSVNKKMKIFHIDKDVKKLEGDEDYDGHKHESDPHIWLDPVLLKTQTTNIANALGELYPDKKMQFFLNLDKIHARLDALHAELTRISENVKRKTFIVMHPSWGYFAERYKLIQLGIEQEGKEIKPADLIKIGRVSTSANVGVVFSTPGFTKNGLNEIAKATNAKVTTADHMSENVESELLNVMKALENAN